MIDSHAHLTDTLYPEIEKTLERARVAGVAAVVNICTDPMTLGRGIALKGHYPWIYNVAATTPHDVEKEGEIYFETIAHHARSGDLVAIGETGLDYYYEHSNRAIQKLFLTRYLRLAIECELPVVIHCRHAFADLFALLDQEYENRVGVLHCFTGTKEEADQVIARGWYISLSGIVTFKKSEELRQVARQLPLDRLLIETDAPYLAPQSHRGKQNEPAYLVETATCLGFELGIAVEQVIKATAENARRLFAI